MKKKNMDVTKLATSCLQMIELRGYSLSASDVEAVIDYFFLLQDKFAEVPDLYERLEQYTPEILLDKTAALQLLTRIMLDDEIEMPVQIDSKHLMEVLDQAMEQVCQIIDRYHDIQKSQKYQQN